MGKNIAAVFRSYPLPFFILLAILLRIGTFYPSVINHDESTYILIGDGLLHGQIYLLDSFDTKPIGIFLIYAFMSFLGGGSIFMFRLFTAVIIGLTAYLLYRLGMKASGHASVGQGAGLIYILLTSIFKFYGLSPNTELFFVPFAVGAISLVWGKDRKWEHFALAGLLLGIGFIIKYVIAADALAIGLIVLWMGWKQHNMAKTILQYCIPLTISFFIPIVLVYIYYNQIGLVDNFMFYTFEVTSKYPVNATWGERALFVLDFFGRFFPFTLLAIFAWRNLGHTQANWQKFLGLWLICVVVMTLLPGKIFGHYQIHIMPVLALMAGYWFYPLTAGNENRMAPIPSKVREWWVRNGILTSLVLWLGISIGLVSYYLSKPDYPRQITAILKEKLNEGDLVYTGNYHHIVYHLLGQKSVTPYVHSSLLYYEHHVEALGIDLPKTAKKIIDGMQPRFILLRHDHPKNQLTDYIYQNYKVSEELPDNTRLLERNNATLTSVIQKK